MCEVSQGVRSVPMDPNIAAQLTSEQIQPYQYDPRDAVGTIFLRRTICSGQAVQHAGNIVVMGDINPGAEIIAGGDIIVWGVLRCMVHAGYPDNENAVV